jgi:putative ATPase
MQNLFVSNSAQSLLFNGFRTAPLAERLRPQRLSDVIGQEHVTGEQGMLTRMIAAGSLQSLILWGPAGCGKTTIARLLADAAGYRMQSVSAVASGVVELKKQFEEAREHAVMGQRTLLFVDEIHRFNRAQQDVLLPVVEDGTITLVGATTENPSFELNGALLSRARVVVLKRLDESALEQLIVRVEAQEGRSFSLTSEACAALIAMADGDGRYLLNMIEMLQYVSVTDGTQIDAVQLAQLVQQRAPVYDKAQESHYNLISALHKSLRGSDVDAALYWCARMLEGGEDPLYIARRLIRFAVEDIGMSDPQALVQAIHGTEAYERLGSPEGELALAQVVIYLATAPKSNAQYVAYKAARMSAKREGSHTPPAHILNAPTALMKDLGYGAGYAYDHDTPEGFSGQNYFPDAMAREQYYHPKERGFEREIIKRLEYWARLRERK